MKDMNLMDIERQVEVRRRLSSGTKAAVKNGRRCGGWRRCRGRKRMSVGGRGGGGSAICLQIALRRVTTALPSTCVLYFLGH